MINKNFYYACIYYTLKDSRNPGEKTATLNRLNAKIVRLHSKRVQPITIDTHEATLFREKVRPFSIYYKCGNGVCGG